MTAFDRIEPRLPELMTSLAAASLPDYVDDMLQAAAQTQQRPAWRSLERWLPMGVTALPVPAPRVPWRSLAIAAAILLVALASLAYIGSRRPALPPPFGLARNGVIVYGTTGGDIGSLDPATGATAVVVGGPEVEQYPLFSNDGTRLVFARTAGSTETDFAAKADGSEVRSLLPSGSTITWWDESTSGDRTIVTRNVNGAVTMSMVDMATGKDTPLAVDPSLALTVGMFRAGHDQIVYEHVPADGASGTRVFIGPSTGQGALQEIPISPDAVNEAWPSPDGSKLVYTTWGTGPGTQGRIHVIDIDSGVDTPVMFDGSAGSTELMPQWSPDSRRLAFLRFGDSGYRVTIGSLDGAGSVTQVGPTEPENSGGATIIWSPDGTQLLVGYEPDDTVWLAPSTGGDASKLDGMSQTRGFAWQRLAS